MSRCACRAAPTPRSRCGGSDWKSGQAHDPPLLPLDEPLDALDAMTRIDMQHLVDNLWQARSFTAFLTTHDVQEAAALAQRVLLIEDGRIMPDRRVGLPRPRSRGNPQCVRREQP